MLERYFRENRRLLAHAISDQKIVRGDIQVAKELASLAELREISPPDELIQEEGSDNDIYFIVSGKLEVSVHDRHIGFRKAGNHVGEMALIDPGARRSASVVPVTRSIVARVSERDFTRIANGHPYLWRRVATGLSEFLRDRNERILPRRRVPRVFVGSSSESLTVANAIKMNLPAREVVATVWNDGVFGATGHPLEDLECQIKAADFGVLVVAPDDRIEIRGRMHDAPRDNVVFEIGLMLGQLWRERTYIVKPKGADVKLPTDLLGLTLLEYRPSEDPAQLERNVAPLCEELCRRVRRLGPR